MAAANKKKATLVLPARIGDKLEPIGADVSVDKAVYDDLLKQGAIVEPTAEPEKGDE